MSYMTPKKKSELPLYNRVRVLRVERDLTRQQLAEVLGVNPQTVGALERGDHSPSLDLAMRVADAFGLPIEAVFSRSEFTPMSNDLYAPKG